MEGNFNGCATGILVDIEDNGNVRVEKTLVAIKDSESEFHLNILEHATYAEKVQSLDNPETSLCITNRFKNLNVGGSLTVKKEMLSISRGGWKTPSPKSMKMIWKEASRIIDQLHSSPIESTEALLVDEDFPAAFRANEGCLNELPESEKFLEENKDSSENNVPVNKSYVSEHASPEVIDADISKAAEINLNNPLSQNVTVSIEHSKPISCVSEHVSPSEVIYPDISKTAEIKLKNPTPDNTTVSIEHSKSISYVSEHASPSEGMDPGISKTAGIKLKNSTPEKDILSMEHSRPISTQIKSKSMYGNAFKTPMKTSKVINKENGSERKPIVFSGMRFPLSDKNYLKRKNLGQTSGIEIVKSKPNVDNCLKKISAAVIPQKNTISTGVPPQKSLIGTTRRNSILPRTSSAIQYQPGSQQKSALCKTSSVVETPNVSKIVRRANSLQLKTGKYSIAKRLETPEQKKESLMSNKNSVRKSISVNTESSMKPIRSRMSISHIPGAGNSCNTPLKRSNSLSKSSVIGTSQMSRPSISHTTHKISSVAENSPPLFKRPVLSTSSRIRFCSRLGLPSNLPAMMNDNLPRVLFPDLRAPMKR